MRGCFSGLLQHYRHPQVLANGLGNGFERDALLSYGVDWPTLRPVLQGQAKYAGRVEPVYAGLQGLAHVGRSLRC